MPTFLRQKITNPNFKYKKCLCNFHTKKAACILLVKYPTNVFSNFTSIVLLILIFHWTIIDALSKYVIPQKIIFSYVFWQRLYCVRGTIHTQTLTWRNKWLKKCCNLFMLVPFFCSLYKNFEHVINFSTFVKFFFTDTKERHW